MTVTVEFPDAVTRDMHLSMAEVQQRALVGFVVECYRKCELSRGQVGQFLNLSFWETETFLKENGCDMQLTVEEFERQSEHLKTYISK